MAKEKLKNLTGADGPDKDPARWRTDRLPEAVRAPRLQGPSLPGPQ